MVSWDDIKGFGKRASGSDPTAAEILFTPASRGVSYFLLVPFFHLHS